MTINIKLAQIGIISNTKDGFTGSITQVVPVYYQEFIDLPDGTLIKFFDKNGELIREFEYNNMEKKWKAL